MVKDKDVDKDAISMPAIVAIFHIVFVSDAMFFN